MPSVSREATHSLSIGDASFDHEPAPAASARPVAAQSNAVEAWRQGDGGGAAPSSFAAQQGTPPSPESLQRALQDRENAIIALTNAKEPLDEVVAASGTGGFTAALLQFEASTAKDPAFTQMMATFPRSEIAEALRRLIQDAAPDASPDDVQRIQQRVIAHLDERVLVQTGQDLRKEASAKLSAAASRFEHTANDPQELRAISRTLQELGEEGAQLREALGVSKDSPLDEASLAAAIKAQAANIRSEGERLFAAGDTTLYRALLLHTNVDASSSASPGSWAAQGRASVLARGKADQDAIKLAKVGSALALAAASGGMSLGAIGSGAMVAGFNAPGLLNSYEAIERARAGVAAGTAQSDAVSQARTNFAFEAGEAALSMTAAVGLGMGHVPSSDAVLGHALRDVAVEAVLADGGEQLHHVFAPHGEAQSNPDGVTQARLLRSK